MVTIVDKYISSNFDWLCTVEAANTYFASILILSIGTVGNLIETFRVLKLLERHVLPACMKSN